MHEPRTDDERAQSLYPAANKSQGAPHSYGSGRRAAPAKPTPRTSDESRAQRLYPTAVEQHAAINERTIKGDSTLSDATASQLKAELRQASRTHRLTEAEAKDLVTIASRSERPQGYSRDDAEKLLKELGRADGITPAAVAEIAQRAANSTGLGRYAKHKNDPVALELFYRIGQRLGKR